MVLSLFWSVTIRTVGDKRCLQSRAIIRPDLVFEQLQCSSGLDADAPGNIPCRKTPFTRIFTETSKGMMCKRPL